MASSSSSFPSRLPLENDDDEFDWEAAVKEIDVACQGATLPSNRENLGNSIPREAIGCNRTFPKSKKSLGTRQSTLDMFVQTDGKSHVVDCNFRPKNGSLSYEGGGDDRFRDTGDERVSTNIDLEAAKMWIYPVNVPLRDYQLSITKTALFSNTLVALPTGLGKTLIAAVVMYNYFRWFPEGKIVFTAPSRPLVMQQIEACHNIVGIPQEWTIDMTGTCLVNQVVCLVIDEAHRAMGNYSYCVAVRELMAVPVLLRILALTATPGSKQGTIQNVIDNLHISTLEYRNESHHDVIPYVHNRKLELMEVTMGKDAIGVNDLLLEAIQPFVTRLCAVGVLYRRDIATLSPCDLLNSRDKFRQAPPLNLPQVKYGEIEGYFGVLITLYHIRKLLSSHGIRPAYEMLEEKLQQGSFARLMGKNEIIWRAKLLMQQSLSHGAPNPKLLKMREVLIDHFKTKDPKESRVIIFSNFRGSVKDIMDSLSNIGEFVKATQFIGQSSGKSLKGQTQKVQQEVLQKFRSGGYNVIVATSIGEEGLDIMEVDLVICFDANISPLRMIQRMGRTGRKHDGRVVVLACQGAELKGYLKKQANSKAVRKHMHNGGTNSFDFHPSPRMVPHICKPEVQFVELSIEQFVPRGRKVKDIPMQRPTFRDKLSDAEMDRVAKYFRSSKEDAWRPSLIAFPHFQAFPSRVHKVRHSFRTTGMLIDTMQSLQGLSSSKVNQTLPIEVKDPSSQFIEGTSVAQDDNSRKDSMAIHDAPKAVSQNEIPDVEASPRETSRCNDEHCMPELSKKKPHVHCFLFGTDFVSVNAFGSVLITSVPLLPFDKGDQSCKSMPANSTELLKNTEQDMCTFRTSHTGYDKIPNSDAHLEQMLQGVGKFLLKTPISEVKLEISEGNAADMEMKTKISPANYSCGNSRDMELSPRLTNFIEKGVVPESPIVERHHYSSAVEHVVCNGFGSEHDKCGLHVNNPITNMDVEKIPTDVTWHSADRQNDSLAPAKVSCDIPKLCTDPSLTKLNSEKNEKVKIQNSAVETNVEVENILSSPIINEIHTPLVYKTTNSSSEDWQLSSGEASKSVQKAGKFRRLCKYGDVRQRIPSKSLKEASNGTEADFCRYFTRTKFSPMKLPGKQKSKTHVRTFIEEEAEVSSDAEVSEDEEDDKDNTEHDDSFIDDRINPTANTQAGASGSDMMAIYRHSLLTQSPILYQPNCSTNSSHESTSPRIAESGSSSLEKINNSLRTPQTGLHSASQSTGRTSVSCQLDTDMAPPGESHGLPREDESKMESRKRKLSFQQGGSVLEANFHQECPFQSDGAGKTSLKHQSEHNELNNDVFYDDEFYEGLDLDAVEAQATESLMYKSKLLTGKSQREILDPSLKLGEDLGQIELNSPSFDLGF
ncbi:DEAD-box ATP-dependent RNA helicase FANCM isoform X2 [Magnolia sinica]|uniref:DEAD-box ATP-dependent RNA helicase FANCM isoform X2 n=1 Tax=Magnolia sinica TaxID=86752 RepID=UPI00265913CE|nr:DEAD-box ATP-dependent RNA helicase FANCM isoform X2 [Magnolia sinica]